MRISRILLAAAGVVGAAGVIAKLTSKNKAVETMQSRRDDLRSDIEKALGQIDSAIEIARKRTESPDTSTTVAAEKSMLELEETRTQLRHNLEQVPHATEENWQGLAGEVGDSIDRAEARIVELIPDQPRSFDKEE